MLPNTADAVGSFKHHRVVFPELLRGGDAADAASDNGDLGLICHEIVNYAWLLNKVFVIRKMVSSEGGEMHVFIVIFAWDFSLVAREQTMVGHREEDGGS